MGLSSCPGPWKWATQPVPGSGVGEGTPGWREVRKKRNRGYRQPGLFLTGSSQVLPFEDDARSTGSWGEQENTGL